MPGRPSASFRLDDVRALVDATLLGAAGEKVGLDRSFQTSPKRGRAPSPFGQGAFWSGALPNRNEERALWRMTAFDEAVREHAVFRQRFGLL